MGTGNQVPIIIIGCEPAPVKCHFLKTNKILYWARLRDNLKTDSDEYSCFACDRAHACGSV